jgi:hypothetical protein
MQYLAGTKSSIGPSESVGPQKQSATPPASSFRHVKKKTALTSPRNPGHAPAVKIARVRQ